MLPSTKTISNRGTERGEYNRHVDVGTQLDSYRYIQLQGGGGGWIYTIML